MSERECKCSMRTKLVGDGCSVCNPQQALEYALDNIKELEQQHADLVGMLKKYGQHKKSCKAWDTIMWTDPVCDCGLEKAIAKAGG